jgi:hypothetical protein
VPIEQVRSQLKVISLVDAFNRNATTPAAQ